MGFYNVAVKVVRGFLSAIFRVEVEGAENIPQNGAFIIAPNHLSNFDPPVLGVFLPVKMAYMAKESLFKVPVLGAIIKALGAFPVKRGGMELSAVKTALRVLKSGGRLVIFPEGSRAKIKGVLGEGKHGVVMIAIKANVPIVPVGINASYKIGSKVKIKIGKAIDLSEYYGKKLSATEQQEITNSVLMPEIAELAGAKMYENCCCR